MAMPKQIILKTHRFVFSEPVTDLLTEFAQIHCYDERKEYKAAWNDWITESDVKTILDEEVERLYENGFEGDALDKMFKSVRYYFRKKYSTNTEKEIDNDKIRTYVKLPKAILNAIDEHIKNEIKKNIEVNEDSIQSDMTPSNSFNNFCNENKQLFLALLDVSNKKVTNDDVNKIIEKLKKTYKNRHYSLKVKLESQN